ncbi:MAG TPA: GTP-binding protein [Lacipirellulaceae bacterium]|nr:GTP-binding protein [Lacipirellulaceae bacterium]
MTHNNDIGILTHQLERGNRAALSRLMTLAAAENASDSLAAALQSLSERSTSVVALTGSGGVGKSSLLGAVAASFAERGELVAVLACDPQSPVTGGALLGDRCRIAGASASRQIFIRSLATPSGQQGIAQNIEMVLSVMKRFAFDRIFVETVGAGQADVAVRSVADIIVVVLQPQTGDDLQWEKAGILEMADVVVINKSDLSGADRTVAELRQQLHSTSEQRIPILKTSVARAEGVEELCRVIMSYPVMREKTPWIAGAQQTSLQN